MEMLEYVMAVKRALRDQHGFTPLAGGTDHDPRLNVPDGEYPVTIDGKVDRVRIVAGKIDCGNFDPVTS